ncbi:hypothetical protein HK104_009803 [Borealophlyctis nickersoniae]|nr:hypothetical protein HK104_009803 [Borealophlyctis nickersoniae]
MDHDRQRRTALEAQGAIVVVVPAGKDEGRVDIREALKILWAPPYNIKTLMVEGGATVIGEFLTNDTLAVDQLIVTIAPIFVGRGVHVAGAVGDQKLLMPELANIKHASFGRDCIMAATLQRCDYPK